MRPVMGPADVGTQLSRAVAPLPRMTGHGGLPLPSATPRRARRARGVATHPRTAGGREPEGRLTCGLRWALRDSNPRPLPCKGGRVHRWRRPNPLRYWSERLPVPLESAPFVGVRWLGVAAGLAARDRAWRRIWPCSRRMSHDRFEAEDLTTSGAVTDFGAIAFGDYGRSFLPAVAGPNSLFAADCATTRRSLAEPQNSSTPS